MIKDEKGAITGYTRTVNGKEYPPAKKIANLDTLQVENRIFGEIGWYYFGTKQYKASLAAFKRGTQLYPEDLNMLINVAHLYLFNNDYPSAIAIYKAHLNDMVKPDRSWVEVLKDDYAYFKNNKDDVTLFDKVFEELGVEKP